MLKFSTTTPFVDNNALDAILEIKPLVVPSKECKLIKGEIKGKDAFIVGKALSLAGFFIPCFFDGNISDLDNPDGEIIMVLPSGEYPILVSMDEDMNYFLELKEK